MPPSVMRVSSFQWMLQAFIFYTCFAQFVLAQDPSTPSGETGVSDPVVTETASEGSCPNAESHATPDFGSQVSTLTFFLYITIFLSLGITYLRNFLKRKTMNYPHIQEVLEGVYEELSVVGVTSFLLFVAETSTLPQIIAEKVQAGDAVEFTSVFHEVHMALFFIVFLFLLTVIVVQLYTKNISRWWYVYETRTLQENIRDWQFVNQLRLRSNLRNWLFDVFHHNRVVEVNDALAFTLIKARFLTQYAGKGGIPANFSFARYLHLSLNEISVHCVHLHWSIWLFTLTAIGLNWIRYKVIPVSSAAASVILMITGIFSVFVFLFLFWKGRAIRRRLLDERHFYDPRFFNKLIHVETIQPISLYDDYAHHKADFTRLLTFTAVQEQHRSEDQWRKEQERRLKEQSILAGNPESQPLAGAVTVHIPATSSLVPPSAQPEKLVRQASTAKLPREIFTTARLNEVSVAQPPAATNNVADLSARDRAASFMSAENSKAYNNPLTPQRAPLKAQGSMRRLSSTSNLNHLLSHKAVMAHPMGKKPNAQSIFDANGEAAGLETKPMLLVQRANRSRDASKRRASANMSVLQASVQNASAQELNDWEKSHDLQIAREKKEADLRSEQTSALLLLDGHHQQAQSAARTEHIYQGEMDATGNIHCTTSPPRESVIKPLDISQHPRHIADVREGDELNDEDGMEDEVEEEEEEDDEAHMRLLQMKQMAMQKFIKEMHEEAISNSKMQCCASIIPPTGSRSQLEEAFILSDPGIHLRLFQIIMLFQSTYLLASVYYFVQLQGQVQVIFLVFTFIPIVLTLIVFLPKFLRNHTITTSLHSEIRLNVVSEMMEAEELQKEEHHMNSLHVRLQARALSLSEVPISAFAGEYISDHEPFRPLARTAADQNCKAVETGLMSMKVRLDKDKEAAVAAAAKKVDTDAEKSKEKAKPVETLWNVNVYPPSAATTVNTGSTPLFSPSMVSDAPTPVDKDANTAVAASQPVEPSAVTTPPPPPINSEVELVEVGNSSETAASAVSSNQEPTSQTVRIVRKSPADSLSAYAGPSAATQVIHVRKTSSSSAKKQS